MAGLIGHARRSVRRLDAGVDASCFEQRVAVDARHGAARDVSGMVAMPDISIHEEMIDLMSASRAYEANLAVVKNARSMAMQTLSIGKR